MFEVLGLGEVERVDGVEDGRFGELKLGGLEADFPALAQPGALRERRCLGCGSSVDMKRTVNSVRSDSPLRSSTCLEAEAYAPVLNGRDPGWDCPAPFGKTGKTSGLLRRRRPVGILEGLST